MSACRWCGGPAAHQRLECQRCRGKRRRGTLDPLAEVEIEVEEPDIRPIAESRLLGSCPLPGVKAPAAERIDRIAGLFDLHGTSADPVALAGITDLLADFRPDLLLVPGDFGEWESISRHSESRRTLVEDLDGTAAVLRRVIDAAQPRRTVLFLGNHERWLDSRTANTWAEGLTSIPVEIEKRLGDRRVEWLDHRARFRLGKLLVMHAHLAFARGRAPEHAAKKLALEHGLPGDDVWGGHTHRPQMYLRPHADGNVAAYISGMVTDPAPDYDARPANGREQGLLLGYVRWPEGICDTYPIRIRNGSFVWNGRRYGRSAA